MTSLVQAAFWLLSYEACDIFADKFIGKVTKCLSFFCILY